MYRTKHILTKGVMLIVMVVLLQGRDAPASDDFDRQALIERQAKLADRIVSLKHEQEFLLMQKAFYASDSKYILLDLPSRTGVLKYRNRVLRAFTFSLGSGKHPIPRNTVLNVTDKSDSKVRRRSLQFGNSLIIQSKRASTADEKEKSVPRVVVGSRDLAALYYAVEQGTVLFTGK